MSKALSVVGVPMMGVAEARSYIDMINAHLSSARRLLLDLYEREGWRALGYSSWRTCVMAEFNQSSAALYRELAAGTIERELGVPLDSVPESQLRPLKVLKSPELRRAAFDRANDLAGTSKRTAEHVQEAVQEIAAPKRRKVYTKERLAPCPCCNHPISQRHHMLPVHRYGETHYTVQLCANCHEAFHVLYRAWLDRQLGHIRSRAITLEAALRDYWGATSHQYTSLCDLVEIACDDIEGREVRQVREI